MNQNHYYHILFAAFVIILASCTHHPAQRLNNIYILSDSVPNIAADSLKAIDYATLSKGDRHFYDFLSVKLTDKTYGTHTSDSLINDVIKYAKRNWTQQLYSEALYYGGRVNSDLNNNYAALHYYQDAIDALPEDDAYINLKSRILSQTGRLLSKIRLYNQAISPIHQSVQLCLQSGDTLNYVYNIQLLGTTYLYSQQYEKADSCFIIALQFSNHLPESFIAKSKMYRAIVKQETHDNDSAMYLIKDTPYHVREISRYTALSNAAQIYLEAEIYDSVYKYGYELLRSGNIQNQACAYNVFLSDSMRRFFSVDTLADYALKYRNITENIYNENDNQLAVIQQAVYNYDIHDRNRAIAERRANIMAMWVVGSVVIILILIIIILYKKNRQKLIIIQLQQAHQLIDDLKSSKNDNNPAPMSQDINTMRAKLMSELINLHSSSQNTGGVMPEIIESDAYSRLQGLVHNGKSITSDSPLWNELESTLERYDPKFKPALQILTSGKLTKNDLHTCILIKYGLTPTQMSMMLNISKGALSSRRSSLSMKMFDKSLGNTVFDEIIKLI